MPLFFAVRFVVIFERLANTLQFLKMIHGYSRSYFNHFLIYAIACDAGKCIPSKITVLREVTRNICVLNRCVNLINWCLKGWTGA